MQHKSNSVFRSLSEQIINLSNEENYILAGIDGYDGSGKSYFATNL